MAAMPRPSVAAVAFVAAVAILPALPARAADRDLAACATSLVPARAGGKPSAFLYLQVMVGSPDGKSGTVAQTASEFDASGKHGRDLFPTAGEPDLFLRCHYEGDRVTTVPLPPETRLCEVDYTYIDDYDTRADRIFCR
jgi:hypothetical protein